MTTATTVTADDQATGKEAGVVHLEEPHDGIAVLRLGAPSESVVTLTERRLDSLKEVLLRLQGECAHQAGIDALVVTGPGPGMFAAGADISLIEAITDTAEGERAATKGQSIFGLFQELPVPVVGAIEGPCLGGGFEMALCFDRRVASNHPTTSIGLPEVKLGIVPGFGGTQRLPRLVGLPNALDLILKGRTLRAEAARRKGLVDRVVPHERLLEAAHQEAQKLAGQLRKGKFRKGRPRKLRGMAFLMSRLGFCRRLIHKKVMKTLTSGQARFYDAPPAALELCIDAFARPAREGLQHEARALGRLVVGPTCKALVRLFFLTERAKRLGKADGARPIHSAHIVGGGAMGAGISGLMAQKGLRVRLCDLSSDALAAAKRRLQKVLGKRLKRRQMKPHEVTAVQDRLAVATQWGRLQQTDFFLEAVVENLDIKQQLFAQSVANGLPDDAIIATNTSSLPIDDMAEGLPNPQRVIGLHFFNPPEKMPLVEVIAGPRTSAAAIATTCRLAVALGKFPVVVKDSPGFLVNRCLAPYLNEAARLMVEGCEPARIDKVMLDFGLPMGPARLMDEIGFDVASKVSEVMSTAFPERMQPSELFAAMVAAGHLGSKSGGGILSPGGTAVLGQLRAKARPDMSSSDQGHSDHSRSDILERLIYPMVDEAYRCLADGLVESDDDLDLGLVMGIGFPPFTGGITRYAAAEGHARIAARLTALANSEGPRFEPCAHLLELGKA